VASSALTVIVGAGISGLTCAYALQKAGHNVLVLEASPLTGGVIQSICEDGYLFELGPQSFSATPALDRLCNELGLAGQLVIAPRASPRFVLVDGMLVAVPMSPVDFLTSRLLGWKTKSAILREVLRTTHPPQTDESIADFARRKFSAELLDRLLGPFVSGVYAGDPEQISLRAAFPKIHQAEQSAGSVVRGMFRNASPAKTAPTTGPSRRRPSLISFRQGNQTMVAALGNKVGSSLRCDTAVGSLSKTDSGFVVKTQSGGNAEEILCDRLVLATPTSAAASILTGLAPEAAASLRDISSAPVAVVSLAYRRGQVRHALEGFGALIPRSAGIRTLGTVWNSSQFPNRAPSGHVLLTSFIGGATDPSAVDLSDQQLSAAIHREISAILGITGQPVRERVTVYRSAIPQYSLGHTERLQRIGEAIQRVPGLWLTGSYLQGPAVGSCIEHALAVAEQVRISYNS
jgi:protoporphyrinogen/coproporphyrinogen III oxidase